MTIEVVSIIMEWLPSLHMCAVHHIKRYDLILLPLNPELA